MKINRKPWTERAKNAALYIILTLPLATLPPWLYPPDYAKTIIFRSLLACVAVIVTYLLLAKQMPNRFPQLKKNPITWAATSLLVIYLLATIFSVDPKFSIFGSPYRGDGFLTYIFYFLFAAILFAITKRDQWQKYWDYSVGVGLLVCLVAFIQFYGLLTSFFVPSSQPGSSLGNPIFLGIYLLLLFFITLSYFINENGRNKKIFYGVCLFIMVSTILIAGSRAAYLGFVVGIITFFLAYPKQIRQLKMGVTVFAALVIAVVAFANLAQPLPSFINNNRILHAVTGKLSLKAVAQDERFKAWQTELQVIEAKPVLGWGPENLAPGFDKFYNPLVTPSPWWDRAHNVFLGIGAEAGILGIVAYALLFVALFWQLHVIKRRTENHQLKVVITGIFATITAYLAANFFSFDSFATYLLFFFIIAYTIHLAQPQEQPEVAPTPVPLTTAKKAGLAVLILALIYFIWQYNIVPFYLNANINIAANDAAAKQCGQTFTIMDNLLQTHSSLDSYIRLEYGELTETCAASDPQNSSTYLAKGVLAVLQGTKLQPLYTRYWIYLGSASANIAATEQDATAKATLLNAAAGYFQKAVRLAPRHPEIPLGQSSMELVAGNYQQAKAYAETCISLDPNLGDCYWYLALSEIYLKDTKSANQNVATAKEKGYQTMSTQSVSQLSSTYDAVGDYTDLISLYQQLIANDPNVAQYHSSIAFFYKEVGDYKDARAAALRVLQLSPASKANVEAFLATLPQ
jgi:O-antigen ligase/tetratricopeptide (TPR) repeat protein